MTRLSIAIALLLTLPVGPAGPEDYPSRSGRALERYCAALDKPNPTFEESLYLIMCIGYADGLVDGSRVHAAPPYCLSEGVDRKQIARTLLAYIKSHPDVIDQPTKSIAMLALQEAFPCPK